MLEKYLQEIGLNEKEAIMYLALLQVDNASVIAIAKETKINRSTVYVVLEGLMEKGLVSETESGKKVHYQAESPERLQTFVEGQKMVLEEQSKRLGDIIPQIKSVQRASGERPLVKYFEGREAALSNHFLFFNAQDKEGIVYALFDKDLLEEVFSSGEITAVQKIRPGKNIKAKTLYTSNKTTLSSNELSERIKIDGAKYPLYCDISIYEDRVQIVTMGKSIATIFIQSKDVAETLKSLFKLAFDNAPTKE
ncbi:MAG: helix-turn-helix domain-containing protein [Candidatus Paceibacterota bacterium]|jgi:sugar-specific transcriptional regulator TrmB